MLHLRITLHVHPGAFTMLRWLMAMMVGVAIPHLLLSQGAVAEMGTVQFTVRDTPVMAMDSALGHEFTFTPAVSLFVECERQQRARNINSHRHDVKVGQRLPRDLSSQGLQQTIVVANL